MNERENEALQRLKQSKKYGDICEATIERVFSGERKKHKSLKDTEKQARAHLYRISGAFLTQEQLRQADGHLAAYLAGDQAALAEALKLHASTRERLPYADALCKLVIDRIGQPQKILDLACGLNPLYLGSKGFSVAGWDIHGGTNGLINRWAERCGWAVHAETRDLLADPIEQKGDLALLMKLLPVLEQQQKGSTQRLLPSISAKHLLVSFPTRTLSGRGVGMEQNYARWFEGTLPEGLRILDQFSVGNELCYLLEGKNG